MKALTWILVVFSGIAVLGMLFEGNPDVATIWGLLYGGLVIAQGILVLNHLKGCDK